MRPTLCARPLHLAREVGGNSGTLTLPSGSCSLAAGRARVRSGDSGRGARAHALGLTAGAGRGAPPWGLSTRRAEGAARGRPAPRARCPPPACAAAASGAAAVAGSRRVRASRRERLSPARRWAATHPLGLVQSPRAAASGDRGGTRGADFSGAASSLRLSRGGERRAPPPAAGRAPGALALQPPQHLGEGTVWSRLKRSARTAGRPVRSAEPGALGKGAAPSNRCGAEPLRERGMRRR